MEHVLFFFCCRGWSVPAGGAGGAAGREERRRRRSLYECSGAPAEGGGVEEHRDLLLSPGRRSRRRSSCREVNGNLWNAGSRKNTTLVRHMDTHTQTQTCTCRVLYIKKLNGFSSFFRDSHSVTAVYLWFILSCSGHVIMVVTLFMCF